MVNILNSHIGLVNRFQKHISENINPIFDGLIHRFGKNKENWYVAHEWTYKSEKYFLITVDSWNKSFQKEVFKSWETKQETSSFKKRYSEITLEAQNKLKIEADKRHKDCKKKWEPLFKKSSTEFEHDYLSYKGIQKFNSKLLGKSLLLIPAYNKDGFTGVQMIFKKDKKFLKIFSPGIEIEHSICPLKPFKNSEYCFLSEGFATAASIQMAFPDIPSISAFSASNLIKAIPTIRYHNPKIKIIIASDCDKNFVGQNAAKKCSTTYPDVIFKIVNTGNPEWTDFNDLHQFASMDAVKTQLAFDESDFIQVHTLGYNDNYFFYTSSEYKQVLHLSSSAHTKTNLFSLAPIKFWSKKYGFEKEGKVVIPWDKVFSELMEDCRKVGIFNPEKIRGTGVWEESGKFYINDGEKVFPKIKEPEYHYQISNRVYYKIDQEMSDEDGIKLAASFKNLCYKNEKDYVYLLAFIVQAQIFSVLPWRFHLWISGEKGTGKTKIVEFISKLVPNCLLTNDATVSGISQHLSNDARITICDETEPKQDKINNIVELARRMSTLGNFKMLRGTPAGKSVTSNTNTVFLMSSIQSSILNSADKSRFFLVEMGKTDNQNKENYSAICQNIDDISKNKMMLFARCFNNIDKILENFKNISNALIKRKFEQRMCDQIGMALACFALVTTKEILEENDIEGLIDHIDLKNSEYCHDNESSDQEDCFDALMDVVLNVNNETIGKAIERTIQGNSGFEDDLSAHGISVIPEKKSFFVSKNSILEKKLPKFTDYLKLLRRDSRLLEPRFKKKINGTPRQGIVLKAPNF